MFCRPEDAYDLVQKHWMMCVVPRPIGWISTLSRDGDRNLAPYSFFNAIAEHPPMVMFASNGGHRHGKKDTARNIRETGEFVCNMASADMLDAVRQTSAPVGPTVDEFELAGLEFEPSRIVRPPRVKGAPIHLECVYVNSIELPSSIEENILTIGRVVGIHISDDVLDNGQIDLTRLRPLARLGYGQFAAVENYLSAPLQERAPVLA